MICHPRTLRNSTIFIACIIYLIQVSSANLNQFDCSTLATEEAVVDGGLDMVKSFMQEFGKEASFDTE